MPVNGGLPKEWRHYRLRKAFPGVTRDEIDSTSALYWDELLAIDDVYREARPDAY